MTGFPPPNPGQPQQPGFGQVPQQKSSNATTSLVLGIVSILCCGLLAGIPAIYFASQAEKEFALNPALGGQGNAKAGKILGIIGSVLSVLGFIVYFLILGASA